MSQNRPQNKEQISYLGKCANKISAWWRQVNLPPVASDLFKMLVSAFGCFAAALFLLALFTAKPLDNVGLLWLSGISLFLSIFLLMAVFISGYCQTFYKCAKILERILVGAWILMFTLLAALGKLAEVFKNILEKTTLEPYLPSIKTLLIVSAVFFMAYFIAVVRLTFKPLDGQSHDKSANQRLDIAFTILLVTLLVIILSNGWPVQYSYGQIFLLLLPPIILLSIQMKKTGNRQAVISSALAFVVLAIVSVAIIWFLHANPNWLWFCFSLLTIAIILLGIGMKKLRAVSKSHVN
jgi:hypothetical protein